MFRNMLRKTKTLFENPFIVVGAITVFGALLRRYHLGLKPLWLDEAVLYQIATAGSLAKIITLNGLINSAPPLFAILLNLTLKIGDSETILRLLPWLGGVAAIPAIYFLARQFVEKIPAYIVSFLAAIALTQTQYSQQLREYSLTFLLATVILTYFFRQLRYPSWGNLALMTLAMVLGVFLQYGLALLIIALNFVCLINLLSVKGFRKDVWQWLISQLIVLCAVGCVYFLSLKQQMRVGFGSTPTAGHLSDSYWNGSFDSLYNFAVTNTANIFTFAFPGLIFLFIFVIGLIVALRDKNNHTALMMFSFPILLTLLAACAKLYPYQGARQDIFLTPMIYVVFGIGVNYLLKVTQQPWVIWVLVLFTVMVGVQPTYNYLQDPGGENMRPVVATLSKLFENGDKIYVYNGATPAFTYYNRRYALPYIPGVYSRENPAAYFQEIDNLLLSDGRMWMAFSHCHLDECALIQKYVSEKRQLESIVIANGAWLYLVH